jgi:hypothetical protein
MKTQQSKNKFGRLLLLVFSSTIIAEVLSGSTTLSRIQFLPTQFLVYGSAAVLIREIPRRLNAGWPTIILLGLAFGLILEGLSLQSVFNPNFLTNNLAFGRSLGTNWVWTAYMPPFHAFFSICTPILLCEVIFDDELTQPWASRTVTYIAGIVLLIMLIALHFLFIKLTHFNTGLASLLILFVVIVLIVFIALKVRNVKLLPPSAVVMRPPYHFWLITVASLMAAGLWYFGFDTIFMANKPAPWIALAAAPVIAISYFALLNFWSMTKIYTVKDRLALVFGLLTGELIFGYFATAGNPTDHYAQLVLMVVVVILLSLLYIKVGKRIASNSNYKYASQSESN